MNTVTFAALGKYGRAANAFYQVASTIGIARRNNFDFAFPLLINHHHRDAFGSKEDCDMYKHFVNSLPLYDGPELPDRFVDWGYHDIVLTESVSLLGHMQSTKYFQHCLDEVRWYFRMKDEPLQNDYVAVHVRLGDYDNAYHPRLDTSYYGPAMVQFPGAKFLIFSDETETAKQMFGDKVEYSEGRDYLEDFKLMKTCKDFIIGNSSYSAFAAVLGEDPEKRVVAPRPWFGERYTNITGEDIYNPDWHVINWQQAKAA
jgi:hypothetical protein